MAPLHVTPSSSSSSSPASSSRSSTSPSSSRLFISVLPSLIWLIAGFYLGGLHSSLYGLQTRPTEDSAGEESKERRQRQQQLQKENDQLRDRVSSQRCHENEARSTSATAGINTNCGSSTTSSTASSTGTPGGPHRHHPPRHSVCRVLAESQSSSTIPTAMTVWTSNIKSIHAASQLLPNDRRYQFHDFTAQVLHLVSPKLPHSIQTLPTDWVKVRRIMDVAYRRYEYLKNGDGIGGTNDNGSNGNGNNGSPPPPPPVRMVVVGGSVLVGRNCRALTAELSIRDVRMPNRECNWAHRLQLFLDAMFGGHGRVIEIVKLALGGTNTGVGSMIWDYTLLPSEETRHADIILNAYSTNDMHVLTVLEAAFGNITIRDKVFEMTQGFVRTTMRRKPCDTEPSLVIHMDDYLGNEQRQIWSTTELMQGVNVLANYYGFASISYSNMMRQLVYADTREEWFSPKGWYPTEEGPMDREIHPGMGMHLTAAWTVAYNLLHGVTTYCSMEPWYEEHPRSDATTTTTNTGTSTNDITTVRNRMQDYGASFMSTEVPLTGYKSEIRGKPKVRPPGLPPILTKHLKLDDVSALWQSQSEAEDRELAAVDCATRDPNYTRCPFSWVGGLSLAQNNMTWIRQYFQPVVKLDRGWKLIDEGAKVGYIPDGAGRPMVLEFALLPQAITTIALFTMRSYGEKWADSQLKVDTEYRRGTSAGSGNGGWTRMTTSRFIGYHAKNTSEIYTETIQLPTRLETGDALRVTYSLERGSTFKVMGIAVCS